MQIGCVPEIMQDESRVGLRPDNLGVAEILALGATNAVRIAKSAGEKSGFLDAEYERQGALILPHIDVWRHSELIVKVKQPLEDEYPYLRDDQMLICFPHLADNPSFLDISLKKRLTIIAYETIRLENGYHHILAEMSKIAGRKALFDCTNLLMSKNGMMLGPSSEILILGLGNAGVAAAELVVAANPKFLYLLDKNPEKFEPLKARFYQRLSPHNLWFMKYDQDDPAHQYRLATILTHIDLLITATYIDGELQTKAVPEWMEKGMKSGSVTADISVDQGGAMETSDYHKQTGKQIFRKHGVWHYCVPNIPGRVPRDSTPALTRETFPYIAELAEKGFKRAVLENPALARGVNTHKGWITHEGLARSIGRTMDYKPLEEV
ncbi:MAG: hypothetical protein WAP23_04350, partial [Candidatus Spechtbacterales bacterium]